MPKHRPANRLSECTPQWLALLIEMRLQAREVGRASKYTRSRLPVRLAYSVSQRANSAALKQEAAIKGLRRAGKSRCLLNAGRAMHSVAAPRPFSPTTLVMDSWLWLIVEHYAPATYPDRSTPSF
jgi:putative endonuclease